MATCCTPCCKKTQKQYNPVPGTGPGTLFVTEFITWLAIVIPVLLTVWRYAELSQCYILDNSLCPQPKVNGTWLNEPDYTKYWGTVIGILLASTVLIYVPIKAVLLRVRVKNNKLKSHRWRPAILAYILLCVLPCLLLVALATQDERENVIPSTLDTPTNAVLQGMILGLTLTEWMSKWREEYLTYNLISAMSSDLFFAYDASQFVLLCSYEPQIYNSDWFYVCFAVTLFAMFKFIPAAPLQIDSSGAVKGAVVSIVLSLLCVDFPFCIVRIWTIVLFGFVLNDLINVAKNIILLFLGIVQLAAIYRNYKALMKTAPNDNGKPEWKVLMAEERKSRYPVCIWSEEHGAMMCTMEDGSTVPKSSIASQDTTITEVD